MKLTGLSYGESEHQIGHMLQKPNPIKKNEIEVLM